MTASCLEPSDSRGGRGHYIELLAGAMWRQQLLDIFLLTGGSHRGIVCSDVGQWLRNLALFAPNLYSFDMKLRATPSLPKRRIRACRRTVSLISAAALFNMLAACQPTHVGPDMNPAISTSVSESTEVQTSKVFGKNDKSAQENLYRLNPEPKQGYEVVLTIKDAPGSFENMGWSAMYQAKGCSYVVNEFAGARGTPERLIEIPYSELADGKFSASVYLDAMLDEDYYGNGVCHWELTSVGPWLRASAAPTDTSFGVNLGVAQLQAEQAIELFYPRVYYPRTQAGGLLTFGQFRLEDYPVEVQNSLFSLLLHPAKVSP